MTSPTEITVNQLTRLIGLPSAPAIVDIRIDEDYALDPRLIPGARRRRYQETSGWMGLYDALYRWCRDAVEETHDWPAHRSLSVAQ